ncbi:hypothetical protein M9435_006843 [Picochlorum sp. BPE23]|nr:hypothetical protein M9435_006843 [Picochlorum sp. BPE23]
MPLHCRTRYWKQFIKTLKSVLGRQKDTYIDLSFLILALVTYGVLFFGLGKVFLPSNEGWAALLLWTGAILGGYIANVCFLPRIVGMLVAGMVLINIPWSAIDSFPYKWGVQFRAAALATIFLRCGLELSFPALKKFKYPSVGPGLIVPLMFRLQQQGLGTDQDIPIVIVIAASFDDIVAITGYAIFSTIAIQPDESSPESVNSAWSIASGPVQVILGVISGILGGYVLSITRIWNTQLKRFLILFFIGLFLMFFFEYWELLSGGALGALFTSLVGSNFWENGSPKWFSDGPSFVYGPECERWMSLIWRWVMEPMLFSTVGALLNFSQIAGGTVPKAIAIVCLGVVVRMLITFMTMCGSGFSIKEKLFFAFAWTPKATVQAALSAAPLTLIQKYKEGAEDYDTWVQWGNDILTTGLFAILICGTLGTLVAHVSSKVLLQQGTKSRLSIEEHSKVSKRKSDESQRIEEVDTADGIHRIPIPQGSSKPLQRTRSADEIDASVPSSSLSRLIPGRDLAMIEEYVDAIEQLTCATHAKEHDVPREELLRLSGHVLSIQKRIEQEIGDREPSVRELFRSAIRRRSMQPQKSVTQPAPSTNATDHG